MLPKSRLVPREALLALAVVVVSALALPAVAQSSEPPVVRLWVGDAFQQKVDASAPGTRFVVAAGVHRLQSVVPKDGMEFTGESGAVLSGAKVLDGWRRSGGWWVVDGQTHGPLPTPNGTMLPGFERDNHREELFVDGQRLRHVGSVSALGAGRWLFDYEGDRIWLGEDPAGRLVETSVAPFALAGERVRDVVVDNLEIRHYANRAQRGAVDGHNTRGWRVSRVWAHHNHGGGVGIGPGMHVHHSRITDNGQLGIGGDGVDRAPRTDGYTAPVVVEFNEIARNKQLGYDWGWEGGGSKFKYTSGAVVRHNWVHGNHGPGIWFDIDNTAARIHSNLVEGNRAGGPGIYYEISYDARIYWNTVLDHRDGQGDESAGVFVSSSPDVEVFENALSGNRHGIMAKTWERGEGSHGTWETTGLHVHRNDVAMARGWTGFQSRTDPRYYDDPSIRFEHNTYRLDHLDATRFNWKGVPVDRHTWQAAGHDTTATITTTGTPRLPDHARPFRPATYGPTTQAEAPAPSPRRVGRLAGNDRVLTAVRLSEAGFPEGRADTVVLARSDQEADALVGAPLAVALDAPILLTRGSRLDEVTRDRIAALGASRVVLLGGESALSATVQRDAAAIATVTSVERLAGRSRYETAQRIAERLNAREVYIADAGRGWPDAVSVSFLAGMERKPILLVGGGRLPGETRAALAALGAEHATVVGGAAVVPDTVLHELRGAGVAAERLAGQTRYETSRAIADRATALGPGGSAWLATGRNWVDALAAGPVVARRSGVLLLVDGHNLSGSPGPSLWLAERREQLSDVFLVGGPAAISSGVEAQVRDSVR